MHPYKRMCKPFQGICFMDINEAQVTMYSTLLHCLFLYVNTIGLPIVHFILFSLAFKERQLRL